ncbi:MAG TPA: S8 family serine peptidase, partial [Vicinamibacterales bacterium]|nr:S8 family serine peptidase [Vicinamibacterales bacterium]
MANVLASISTTLRLTTLLWAGATVFLLSADPASAQGSRHARLSSDLAERLRVGDQREASVIITGTEAQVNELAERHGLLIKKRLVTGAVVDVPAGALAALADDPSADHLSSNHAVGAQMAVTNQSIGADVVHEGGWAAGIGPLTGKGIGIAVIDSGVANLPELRGRIVASVDFTDDHGPGVDLNGHGTHVAGIIAAAGRNPHDETSGVAPGANIISLRVLNARGRGVVGDVIEAIDYAIANKDRYNIRVINMSLGGPVAQGWRDDPLCQAVERAYRSGITVVAAAGNWGKDELGRTVYGGITTPGISPFAITVGALNSKGTPYRSDDEVASYSSRGPTLFDRLVKPDLVAPGNKILGLAAPGSTLVREHPELVVSQQGGNRLQLSGTSMATAVVSGTVGLVLNRQSGLSPLSIRGLLQFSAERSNDGLLVSGTGRLNALAALSMPRPQLAPAILGEVQSPSKLLFAAGPVFLDATGKNILWGSGNNILWGSDDNILWGSAENILWGSTDNILWGSENILWGSAENILWGSDNILWGSDNILWGSADNILWGSDNILWGSDNILWGSDNILWGSDNILWGSDNILWG